MNKKLILCSLIASTVILFSALAALAESNLSKRGDAVQLTQTWDKTFPKSKTVEHRKVTFKNRYGITLAADLYLPKNRVNQRLAAIAVSGPLVQ